LNFELLDELFRLAPFGVANPSPVFLSRKIEVSSVTSIGDKHLKLRLSDGKTSLPAVAWGFRGHPLCRKGTKVDIVFTPEINSYRGISSVQLNLRELLSCAQATESIIMQDCA